ncbi:MAG: hypothetical protein M1814_006317 [Vezdaea aestivalis]|nr:MAG: hypothetical protein M1814_006317 [Vezdaea aestivalis]
MEGISPLYFQQETRLSCDPVRPASTLTFDCARPSSRHNREPPIARDEKSFAALNLASVASVFFSKVASPRGILWRILNNGKTLTLQSLDIQASQPHNKNTLGDPDHALVLRLNFPQPIRPHAVVFTECKSNGLLQAFILTYGNVLYTLHLKEILFSRVQASEGSISDWCKTFTPSSFTFRYPHRVTVFNENELVVSLHDGGLLRLTRDDGGDGTQWTESLVNDGGWKGSIRGLLPWNGQGSVKYESVSLSLTTATSIIVSPLHTHVYAVGLNHSLKVWNLSSGQVEHECDLLNETRKLEDAAKYHIDPSRSHLIELIPRASQVVDLHYLVTFSPVGAGQFKFWAVRKGLQDRIHLVDLFPEEVFEPRPPDSEIWAMADFKVAQVDATSRELSILWKHNTNSCIQTLPFEVLNVGKTWGGPWMQVILDSANDDPTPFTSVYTSEDSTSEWLAFLFSPGRFTSSTLETSLSVYQSSSGLRERSTNSDDRSLQERLCQSVGSHVSLSTHDGVAPDYEKFTTETRLQWLRLYRIANDLEKKRREALSIVMDGSSQQMWFVTADGISLIRNLGEAEILHHNEFHAIDTKFFKSICKSRKVLQKFDHVHQVYLALEAAATFRNTVSEEVLRSCAKAVKEEALHESSASSFARLTSLFNRCGFDSGLGDDEARTLIASLIQTGALENLSPGSIGTLCSQLLKRTQNIGQSQKTAFGDQMLARAAQDVIAFNSSIFVGLCGLVVFLGIEEDDEIPESLDCAQMFLILDSYLKDHQLLEWLSQSTVAQNMPEDPMASVQRMGNLRSTRQVSLLQQLIIKPAQLPLSGSKGHPLPNITRGVHALLLHADVSDGFADRCMANLLRRGEIALAQDLSKHLRGSELSSYLQGRLNLALQDYRAAAACFKQAAHGLSVDRPIQVTVEDLDHLIMEDEAFDFHHGHAHYNKHIADLFGRDKQYSYAAEFATLAIQFLSHPLGSESQDLQTTLLSTLFYASLKSSQYTLSYSALTQFTDLALQSDALRRLVTTLVTTSRISLLLSLPFLDLQPQVDAILASKCHTTLSLNAGPSWHRVLFYWRKKHGDFRGAAEVLYELLSRMRNAGDETVVDVYVLLISTLMAVGEGEAWILSEGTQAGEEPFGGLPKKNVLTSSSGKEKGRRKLVTLEDVKREYHQELDRLATIESGDFPFGDSEEMEGVL